MIVEVRLFATLRNDRFKKEQRTYPENTTVQVVMDDLNIPYEDIAILLKDGRDATLDTMLEEGCTLSVFPPVGGG